MPATSATLRALTQALGQGNCMSQPSNKPNPQFIGAGIAIGAGIGAALGVVFGNIAMGVSLGVAFGVVLGAAMGRRNRGT